MTDTDQFSASKEASQKGGANRYSTMRASKGGEFLLRKGGVGQNPGRWRKRERPLLATRRTREGKSP